MTGSIASGTAGCRGTAAAGRPATPEPVALGAAAAAGDARTSLCAAAFAEPATTEPTARGGDVTGAGGTDVACGAGRVGAADCVGAEADGVAAATTWVAASAVG
ncbi:MAG: hypothetical protein JNL96_02075 [Planctomycetaceae bacterium]|nr:hypothetical protein [Planctomycetaceae bacterium]